MKIKIGKEDKTKYIGNIELSSSDEANGEEMSMESIKKYDCGDIVTIWDDGKRFAGSIIDVDDAETPPYTYRICDFTRNLNGETIYQCKDIRADKAIETLLKKYGVKCKVCSMPTKIKKIYKGTILETIKDIMSQTEDDQGKDYYLEMNIDTLEIKEKKTEKISPKIKIEAGSSIARSIEERRNRVVASKSEENAKALACAKNEKSEKKYGILQKNIEVGEKTTSIKAKTIAEHTLERVDVQKNTTSLRLLVTEGAWDIKKNRMIKIKTNKLNGWYKIRSAQHEITSGTHFVTIELEWST